MLSAFSYKYFEYFVINPSTQHPTVYTKSMTFMHSVIGTKHEFLKYEKESC